MLDRDFVPDRPMVTTLLGSVTYARHKEGLSLFDGAGQKWKCTGVTLNGQPIAWVHRLCTFLLINPTRPCMFVWAEPTPYLLAEVTALVRREVAEDDDILTQFHEKDEWTDALGKVKTLKDVLTVYRRMTRS